jgi:hypothetical protein
MRAVVPSSLKCSAISVCSSLRATTTTTTTTTLNPSLFHHPQIPHHTTPHQPRSTVNSLLSLTTIPSASTTPLQPPPQHAGTALFAFTSLFPTRLSAAPQSLLRAATPWRPADPHKHQASPLQETQEPSPKWPRRSRISWLCQSSCKRRSSNTYVPQPRASIWGCVS